jgi:hypothetical protein
VKNKIVTKNNYDENPREAVDEQAYQDLIKSGQVTEGPDGRVVAYKVLSEKEIEIVRRHLAKKYGINLNYDL